MAKKGNDAIVKDDSSLRDSFDSEKKPKKKPKKK